MNLFAQTAQAVQQAIEVPQTDYVAVLPEFFLIGTGLAIVLLLALRRWHNITWYALIAAVGSLGSGISGYVLWRQVQDGGAQYTFRGMVVADGFSTFVVILTAITAVLGVALANDYLKREGLAKAEYYALVLFSAAGVQLMAMANNLVMVFIALELLSVCLYVLSAWNRRKLSSQEAGMKYMMLGAYTSAIMLFGIAMLYGATGTLNISALAQFFAENLVQSQGLVLLGIGLTIVGLAFKIAAVPFHMWSPDVYQGAPAPVVGYMATAAKIGAFAALLRILHVGLATWGVDWQPILWTLAVLSMVFGAAMAIAQSDVKRMMAYSSISHAGFIAIGVTTALETGRRGSLFYLVAYMFMVVGAFAVIGAIGRRGEQYTSYDAYRGLISREPLLAGAFTFLLLAMGGIPGTSGFVAKFSVFVGAADAKQWTLIVIGTLAAVVSMFVYIRLIVLMYMEDPHESAAEPSGRARVAAGPGLVLVVAVAATLFLGIAPGGLLNWASQATF